MTGDRLDADGRLLQAEADRICASAEFGRAPVMRRLLEFLVEETIAGRGDGLKAYGVAVDGLGRAPDFDPQADSYPRVQVGRLRRMIDQYYQRYGSAGAGGRLSLPSGSYRLYWTPDDSPVAQMPVTEAEVEALPMRTGSGRRWRIALILCASLALILASGWAALHWQKRHVAATPTSSKSATLPIQPPEIVLTPIRIVEQADPELAQRIDRILADALPRSWLLTVRAAGNEPPTRGYRLTGTLVGAQRKLLYLALWDAESQTQIWSQRIEAGVRAADVRATLNPSIAALMSPYGVIGSRERRRLAGDYRAGFPCMMRYTDYYTSGDRREEGPVGRCLDETLRLDPGYGPAVAAKIILLYRIGLANPDRATAIRQNAMVLAQQAVDADPYSPDAQLALGLAAYSNGLCDQGRNSVLRALDLNPYDAYAQGRAGLQMFQCDDPDYDAHLRLGWQLDPSLPPIMAMPIIIDMAEKGRGKDALRFANGLAARDGPNKSGYAITMAVAHAAASDVQGARVFWHDAAMAAGTDPAASPAAVLSHIVFIPGLARRTETYLRSRGVFGTG